jgi:rhamnosyltransferase subunit B
MRFLLSAIGSAGDVHPFIAIARVLQARGHDVALMASPYFEARVQRAGIAFVPLGRLEDFERVVGRAELWQARRGARLLIDELLDHLPEACATTAAHVTPGTILVGSTLSWGMRLVQESQGLVGATIHLSPLCLPSAIGPPVLPGIGDLAWLPIAVRRLLLRVGERWVLDPLIAPRLDRVRADLARRRAQDRKQEPSQEQSQEPSQGSAVEPVRRIVTHWMHSPDLVIGAWPAWFAAPRTDWPPHSVTTGFPLHDDDATPLPPALAAFLDRGEPPIGITPGSAMAHGESFFARALDACRTLGRRAVLITPYQTQLPQSLPEWAHHVAYAPFGALLPRLAALIHHGGIGTSAQALAAGRPQLIAPFAHDQFDNAARLRRLGVARVVSPVANRVASPVVNRVVNATRRRVSWSTSLADLFGDAAVADAVALAARRMREEPSAAETIADRLERLGRNGHERASH